MKGTRGSVASEQDVKREAALAAELAAVLAASHAAVLAAREAAIAALPKACDNPTHVCWPAVCRDINNPKGA